jgi:hypothetical protein
MRKRFHAEPCIKATELLLAHLRKHPV